jgi:hypothetical protein
MDLTAKPDVPGTDAPLAPQARVKATTETMPSTAPILGSGTILPLRTI